MPIWIDRHPRRVCCRAPLRRIALRACAVGLLVAAYSAHCWNAANAAETALNQLTPQEVAEGWILLFDGETMFGWEPGGQSNWSIADGALRVSEGEVSLLATTSEFADYQLHVEFRTAKETNSGVFLRTPLKPADPGADCFELNIAPVANPFPTGSFVKRKRADDAPEVQGWQTFDVRLEGPRCVVKLNGRQVLDYTDPGRLRRGRIGLQHNQGVAEFRNVKLRPLALESLFNGRDLASWTLHADNQCQVDVTGDGEMHVRRGKGQVETERRFADFVLQIDCFTASRGLNSGVFFRNLPGQMWQGYESQIHNAYIKNDPAQPADFGTGGFYRRQKARRIVASDGQWFTKTVVVHGNHMATWVNGQQVSDWTDTREIKENAREGLRLEAGTLALQAHDNTTNLKFRRILAAETPR